MKTAMLACAGVLAIGLASCSSPPPTTAPTKASVAPDCPDASAGTLFGSPGTTEVSDKIVNSAGEGQPLNLKLQYAAGLGTCVDGKTGDIHLYSDKATNGQFTLTFASNLNGQASWPTDANQAIQVAYTSDAQFGPPPANAWTPAPSVVGGGSILIFTVPSEKGHNYRYRLQYTDNTGALQTVEPMIFNH